MNQSTHIRSQFDIEPHVGRKLGDVEKDLILGTLARCCGNRTWASEILGISVRTLRNKMLQYNGAKELPPRAGRRKRSEEEAHLATLGKFQPGSTLPS